MARRAAEKMSDGKAKGKPAGRKAAPPAPAKTLHGVHASPRLTFALPQELKGELESFCGARSPRFDKSEVMRLALREYLDRQAKRRK